MPSWAADLAEVRARHDALGPGDYASAMEHAVEWRIADPFSGFFLPLPPVAQEPFSAYGGWRATASERGDWVALDVSGRPVAHVLERGGGFERTRHLWWWDEDGSLLEIDRIGPQVRRARAIDGRWAHIATFSRGHQETVELLTWRDGRPLRCDGANDWWVHARTADYDADGTLLRIRGVREPAEGDLEAGLARAAGLDPSEIAWDARLHAPEPWPGNDAALARAVPLAVALDGALRAAAADSDVDAPFLMEVLAPNARFPPIARLHGARWRDRMRRSSSRDGAALFETGQAHRAGLAPDIELVDRLDVDALRTCRMLSTAYHASDGSLHRATDRIAAAVGDELSRLLNAAPLPGAADPFLAAVYFGGGSGARDRVRARVGKRRFAEFFASLRSTKPRGAAARQLREQARRALADRDALEAFLAEGGLPAHAAALAEPGLLLLHAGGTRVRSRLGGPPLLPAGEPWPERLTFVAGIALDELPPSALPDTGWLLFFIDFGTGDGDGLTDPAANEPGAPARVFWTQDVVDASGSSLEPRPVVAQRFLTLPDAWTAGERLGLDVYDRTTYEELAERLEAALPVRRNRHWLGGHAVGAQGEPLDRDTTLLLSIEEDGELGFSFQDAGTVQFRIPPDALAERDFARVMTFGDSC